MMCLLRIAAVVAVALAVRIDDEQTPQAVEAATEAANSVSAKRTAEAVDLADETERQALQDAQHKQEVFEAIAKSHGQSVTSYQEKANIARRLAVKETDAQEKHEAACSALPILDNEVKVKEVAVRDSMAAANHASTEKQLATEAKQASFEKAAVESDAAANAEQEAKAYDQPASTAQLHHANSVHSSEEAATAVAEKANDASKTSNLASDTQSNLAASQETALQKKIAHIQAAADAEGANIQLDKAMGRAERSGDRVEHELANLAKTDAEEKELTAKLALAKTVQAQSRAK